jgi:putative aminopeptidase FrvX
VVKDELIEREGMKWQLPSVRYGRTELGWLLKNAGRLRGGVLQCPSLNYHTNYETTTRQCVENMYRVISSIIPKL